MYKPLAKASSKNDLTTSADIIKPSDLTWVKYGCYKLTKQHRSILCGNGLLDDYIMGAAQFLIKKQFPEIGELNNTLISQKLCLIQSFEHCACLQIVHVSGTIGHWIVLSTIGCDKEAVNVYDSLYPSVNEETETIIARLLFSASANIQINMMNVSKQQGTTDCGIYAIATLTALAFGSDPSQMVFDQTALRPHLQQCFDKGFLDCFPVKQSQRRTNKVIKQLSCNVYCSCRLPEHYDTNMTECEDCHEWYHHKCIDDSTIPADKNKKWICASCSGQCDN